MAAARPVVATIPLTPFQAEEVQHGLEVDETDGADPWGIVHRTAPRRGGQLDVYDLPAAVYRVTSSRDICRDNADDGFSRDAREAARARSLQLLTDKLVAAAGGPDALPPETRRWL